MIVALQPLIEALRNELQQYGEMLALLDHQQELVRLEGADEILHSISAIDAQSGAIQAARGQRELALRSLGGELGRGEACTFAQVVPLIPEQYRPLVRALVQENNELLQRVRQRAQENHLLLRRSLDTMQRFITTLAPQDGAGAAARREGPAALATEPGPALYEAIV